MKKFFDINELRTFCHENNLNNLINGASTPEEAKAKIKNLLPKGKNVSDATVKAYIKELLSQLTGNSSVVGTTDDTLSNTGESAGNSTDNATLPLIEQGEQLAPDLQLTSDEKITDKNESIEHQGEEEKPNTPDEKIEGKTSGQIDGIYVDSNKLKEIDSAKDLIAAHEKKIKQLINQIDELNQRLSGPEKEIDKDNNFFPQISNLNELLNSNNEKITVSISKDLLGKATRFVDAHSLVRLESIVREGYDLNSTIVQSILLAFIHQNSLL